MGDDSEWLKLPAEEKCQHKTWKARLAGYEEVTKIFSQQTDPKSPEFQRYAGLMKKFVTDTNAVAQEKALDAVLAFVENAAVASRVTADVVSGVIAKCLGAPRQKTKDKGTEIVLMFVEIEKPDVVQECLLQGTENKNPKIVVGSIQLLRMALHDFGYKVMPIKPVMKILPKLLEDRDKNIREETKQLVIEIYRWIGNAIKPQMSHFKPVQMDWLSNHKCHILKPVQALISYRDIQMDWQCYQNHKCHISNQYRSVISYRAYRWIGNAIMSHFKPDTVIVMRYTDGLAMLSKPQMSHLKPVQYRSVISYRDIQRDIVIETYKDGLCYLHFKPVQVSNKFEQMEMLSNHKCHLNQYRSHHIFKPVQSLEIYRWIQTTNVISNQYWSVISYRDIQMDLAMLSNHKCHILNQYRSVISYRHTDGLAMLSNHTFLNRWTYRWIGNAIKPQMSHFKPSTGYTDGLAMLSKPVQVIETSDDWHLNSNKLAGQYISYRDIQMDWQCYTGQTRSNVITDGFSNQSHFKTDGLAMLSNHKCHILNQYRSVEIYRWIGNAIKTTKRHTDGLAMLSNHKHFKPVQVSNKLKRHTDGFIKVTELEGEFEKLGNEKAQQQRFMRSQQDLKAKMEEAAATAGEEGGDDGGEEEEEAIDPYELMPSVDILKQLPADFFDKIEAKKWQERKEALDALLKLVQNPKIENGDFGPLVKCISKVIAKDTNVILVGIASRCLTGLAIGLRKKFSPYALNCIQMILDKFKEKKPAVVTALRDASDAIYPSTNLEAISEDVVAALDNKNPQIKTETASFLSRCFSKCTTATLPKKMLKMFCTALLKTINDTTPEVREASYAALGMAMRVVTEKNIMPFLPDVDAIKMQKIKESCEKAVLLNAKGEPRSGGGSAVSKPAPAKAPEPKPVARPKTTAKSDRPKTAPAKSTSKKDTKGKGGGKKGGAAAGELPTESVLSDEAVEDKAGAVFPGDTLKQLTSANWKDRLAAMENITQTMKGMSKDEIPCQAVVKTVAKKPGLKDNNFQVLKLRIELITLLAKNAKFTKVSAECVLSDLVDKIGDVKQGKSVQECLSCIAEATSLEFICKEVIPLGFENKNPKNTAETLVWLAQAVKDFGLKLSVKPLITYIKKAFAATNPAVRASAITVTSVIYMYMGQQFRMFFEDEKPALLQQIDAEFEKVKGEKPPAPTRGVVAGGEVEEEEEEDEDAPKEEVNLADLIDRNDIGEKFTPELMESLVDKNWKIRKEALEKISTILKEAKFINGNLGSLPEGLKVRLGDNNKVLVGLTIGICVTLATNMGPHCKAHIKTIGPALLGCFGDMKPLLRQQAVNALTLWTDQTSLLPLVECEALMDTLKMENPNLRIELLGWLTEKLPDHKKLPVEFRMCIPHLLSCLEDRNGEVRKKAQDAVVPFMIHTGYDSVFKATSKLKPASKDQIMAIIEKARGNLPAKPVKQVKKAASSSAVSKPVKDDYDEPEPAKSRPVSAALSDSGDAKPAKTVKGKGKAAPPPATSKKKKADEDTSPFMTLTETKEKRFKEEKALKVLKWNFIELRGEFIEQLRTQMEKNFNKTIMDQMFQTDFKLHIKAIESLMKCINSLHDETVGNLDLILKWFTIRFFDTNPSMLNKAIEYLREVFTMLSDEDYHLVELEASSFIPYLIIKVGENKDNVRREVRSIFKLICKVYPASKMFTFLLDGLKSKNSKQRMECLEELGCLIESHGINICQPTPAQALKTIAGNIGDKDNGVRNAALNTTVVAYMILQDKLFKFISLKEKDQSMLDERIKRAMKNKPAQAAVEERPRTAPQQQPQKPPSQSNMQRPHTAMPKSASSNSVKKEFALEVDDDQMSQPEMPKLYQYDLDELFQPVSLPSAG
ncbi:CKAP5 [Mytilus edulis]|uniref:CKAP5 n=1 Tax=Mytilus edulis TaxID=6550 RepID=A0A8S3R6S8_MYTED|nr:CKAP5 [Mytilus edulis]